MTNKNIHFDIIMKLAAKACLDAEVAEFDAIDTSNITVSKKTAQKVGRAMRLAAIKDSYSTSVLKKIAIACLLVGTILFTTAMCIQPVRAAFWDAIVT